MLFILKYIVEHFYRINHWSFVEYVYRIYYRKFGKTFELNFGSSPGDLGFFDLGFSQGTPLHGTMPAPDGYPVLDDGTTSNGPRSYANVTAAPLWRTEPRLKPVHLASRPLAYMDSTPLVIFSPVEVDQLNKQRENTLIMKFSAGRPKLHEILAHIAAEWNLSAPPAVGIMDLCHYTIHMASPSKIKNCLIRLFR